VKQKVDIEIDVPDGYELESINPIEVKWFANEQDFTQTYAVKFKAIKPAKKVIDLSCVVGSGIDCEFSDNDQDYSIGCLTNINNKNKYKFSFGNGDINFKYCRIRQSPHVHFWQGAEKCPLPDGLKVRLVFHEHGFYERFIITGQDEFKWQYVIGFEVLGVADGYRYEWEEE
jgi:hypothetical protein